jgi:ABC-2 type transport system permease protein
MINKLAAIGWKDTLLRFSSKSEWLFFLVLPVVFTFFIAGGVQAPQPGGDPRLPVLVVDEDQTALSAEVLRAVAASGAVRPVAAESRAVAEQALAEEQAAALLVIPAGLEAALRAGQPAEVEVRSLPQNLSALAAENALNAALGQAGRALSVARAATLEAERVRAFDSAAARQAYFDAALAAAQAELAAAPARLAVSQAVPVEAEGGQPGITAAQQASAGQVITWVFIPLLGVSGALAYERERGTLRRLFTTPTSRATYLLGTIGGQLAIALVQMALLIGSGVFLFRLDWARDPLALGIVLVAFGLAAVALGTTLGTFVKTEQQAANLSIALGMALALLGGAWYPLELFPEVARRAALALPTRWAMEGLTDLVARGQGVAGILPEAAVLVGFAVAFFAVGVARFRWES